MRQTFHSFIAAITYVKMLDRLRSKRFRGFFRPFEAFFAFWRRENWGERNKWKGVGERGEAHFFALAPIFARSKREKWFNPAETLAMQATCWKAFTTLV